VCDCLIPCAPLAALVLILIAMAALALEHRVAVTGSEGVKGGANEEGKGHSPTRSILPKNPTGYRYL